MKNKNQKTENKANVKELALEKLRKTEGGDTSISGIIDQILGYFLPDHRGNN